MKATPCSDEEDFAPWPASDPDRLDVLADELEELRSRIWRLMQNYVSDLDGAPLTRGYQFGGSGCAACRGSARV
jgi:hypothetical protein